MALRDAFVNIAKNAAAGAAQKAVSGVASSLRSGLGGSSSSSASSPLQTNFTPESGILLYPSDVGTNMHQASYILFARHSVSGAKVKSKKKAPRVDKIMKIVGDDFGAPSRWKIRLQPEKHNKRWMQNLRQNKVVLGARWCW